MLIRLLSISTLCLYVVGVQSPHLVDGSRWLSLPVDEQLALLDGYIDYYRAEVDATRFRSSTDGYAGALRTLLKGSTSSQSLTIGRLLAIVAGTVRDLGRPRAGEHYEGKHGYYNLDYWASALNSKSSRARFVEGYLAAHGEDPNRQGRYSKAVAWYEEQISAELKRRGDWGVAIGDLLEELQDKLGTVRRRRSWIVPTRGLLSESGGSSVSDFL